MVGKIGLVNEVADIPLPMPGFSELAVVEFVLPLAPFDAPLTTAV